MDLDTIAMSMVVIAACNVFVVLVVLRNLVVNAKMLREYDEHKLEHEERTRQYEIAAQQYNVQLQQTADNSRSWDRIRTRLEHLLDRWEKQDGP
jgi:hypothetical protein